MAQSYLLESWQQKILDTLKWHFANPPLRPAKPLYISGSIGSSGSLVRDPAVLIQWLQDARSIRAVEMEAGGVFQAAQQLRQQYPVMAIRGISDIVGLKRDYRWTLYACHSAAAFTYALLTANSQLFENLQPPDQAILGNGVRGTQTGAAPTHITDQAGPDPIKIYISYAEKDERLKRNSQRTWLYSNVTRSSTPCTVDKSVWGAIGTKSLIARSRQPRSFSYW